MKETRAYMVYPEYFDENLTRKKGRKLPLERCVTNPKLKEIQFAAEKLGLPTRAQKRKSHPANWIDQNGRLVIPNNGIKASKRTVLKKIGKVLPAARKLLRKKETRKRRKETRKSGETEKYLKKVLKKK